MFSRSDTLTRRAPVHLSLAATCAALVTRATTSSTDSGPNGTPPFISSQANDSSSAVGADGDRRASWTPAMVKRRQTTTRAGAATVKEHRRKQGTNERTDRRAVSSCHCARVVHGNRARSCLLLHRLFMTDLLIKGPVFSCVRTVR